MTSLTAALVRISRRIESRLEEIEQRLDQGDESLWPVYLATIETAALLERQLVPGAHGELLTTKQMAERLNLSPKTLLRRKGKGELKPAMQRGRLIRWRANG